LDLAPLSNVQVGDVFTVKVTPTDADNFTGGVFTSPQAVVTSINPFVINAPTITSASFKVNGTGLKVTPVATDPNNSPVTFTFQWFRNGVVVANSTSQSIDLAQIGNVQVGDVFHVLITPTNANNITGAVFTTTDVTITGINPF